MSGLPGPVPDRTGKPGRRASWCSNACRQAAWRSRRAAAQATGAAREAAEQIPAARRDLAAADGALQAVLDRMVDVAAAAAVRPEATGGRDADTVIARRCPAGRATLPSGRVAWPSPRHALPSWPTRTRRMSPTTAAPPL
ncbi:hypothetical protein AB0C74_38815 [Spirillospora sp. NPDC048832]